MSRVVLDASLIMKWYLPDDPLFEDALALRDGMDGVAPAFVQIELANALWKYVRAGLLDVNSACAVVSSVAGRLELVADEDLIEAAQRLSASLDHAVYDCLYIALARRDGLVLATVDKRLAARAADLGVDVRYLSKAV